MGKDGHGRFGVDLVRFKSEFLFFIDLNSDSDSKDSKISDPDPNPSNLIGLNGVLGWG